MVYIVMSSQRIKGAPNFYFVLALNEVLVHSQLLGLLFVSISSLKVTLVDMCPYRLEDQIDHK